jgi:hypothetical protein
VADAWNCEVGMAPTPYDATEVVFVDILEKKIEVPLYTVILLHLK